MNRNEKKMILAKLQELTRMVESISINEETPTLFDTFNSEATPQESKEASPKRTIHKDGTMTAKTLARHLTKEFGSPVSQEMVVKIGKECGAKSDYNGIQHARRYSPESVRMICSLFRSFNRA